MLAGVAAAVALIHATGVPVGRARRARRRLAVGRATGARPGARLGLVAFTGGWPADRPGVPRRVLAGVARSVALIRAARVAVVRARGAGGALRIRRAAGARPGAILRRVALAARRPTDGARRLEGVGGADRARPRAVLVDVTHTRRRAADRAGVPRRVLAGVVRPVEIGRASWREIVWDRGA